MSARRPGFALACAAALALLAVFLALPLAGLLTRVPPRALLDSLDDPGAIDALRLSLETSLAALGVIVLVGTPAAWLLATRRFRGRAALVTLLELPLVVPPAVAGIALLTAYGPRGLLGGLSLPLVLQTGGVVVALVFVASPFYLRQAQAAFAALDRGLLEGSRILGAGELRTLMAIAIPLARHGLLTGAALAWARALGEFGATLLFAGSLRGVTQTAPLAIYDRFATDFTAALALSVVLVVLSGAMLLTVRLGTARGDERA